MELPRALAGSNELISCPGVISTRTVATSAEAVCACATVALRSESTTMVSERVFANAAQMNVFDPTLVHILAPPGGHRGLSRPADQAECARKILTSCSATICSSPGCNMNEFIASPGRPSPPPITIDGFELRNL